MGTVCVGQQGTLPPKMRYRDVSKPFNPATAKIGDKACVCPASASFEHHVWVRSEDFYAGSVCVFRVERIKDGWRLRLGGIPLGEIDHDAAFKSLGYMRIVDVQ